MAVPTPRAARFVTTRWSLVAAAGGPRSTPAHKALSELCVLYWEPVYCFLRRRGHEADEAMDLTQGFFARLLEKGDIGNANRERGRFRSFLLGALDHYLLNELRKERAQKRGGGVVVLSMDQESAEEHFRREPVEAHTPESLYLCQWALRLLEHARTALQQQYAAEGKGELFAALEPCLTGDKSGEGYRAIGERLGLSEGAVKVAVHRLRKRYREALRAQVGETVTSPEEIDDEIRFLIQQLG